MPDDSTPTTVAEVTAALALVNAAQEPEPWAPNFFFPRLLGGSPQPVLIQWDSEVNHLVMVFDEDLDTDDPIAAANFDVAIPVGGGNQQQLQSPDFEFGDPNTIIATGTLGITSFGNGYVSYTGGTLPALKNEFGVFVQPFFLPVSSAP